MREKQIKGKLATDWNCIRCSFSTLLISFCAEHLIGFCSRFFFLVSFSLWTTCCLRRNKRSKPERRSRRTFSSCLFSLKLFYCSLSLDCFFLMISASFYAYCAKRSVLLIFEKSCILLHGCQITSLILATFPNDSCESEATFLRSLEGRLICILCAVFLKKKKRKNAWIYIGHQGPVNGKLYVIDLSGGWCGSIDGMQISIRVEGNRKQLKWPPSPNVDLQTCPLLTLMMDQS